VIRKTRTVWLDVVLGRGARVVVGESSAAVAALPRGGDLSGLSRDSVLVL
jgi:hypothetical protein